MNALLSVNVNDKTEKKGQLTYLSWAWAWAEVLKHDPAATWVAHLYGPQGSEQPCMWIGETAIVHTSVTINGTRRECMLPVMDHKNNSVKLPDSRKISDAIMRCMCKAIAMHGLGLYIYAGEDLPEDDDGNAASKPRQQSAAPANDGFDLKTAVAEVKAGIARGDASGAATYIVGLDKANADAICNAVTDDEYKALELIWQQEQAA